MLALTAACAPDRAPIAVALTTHEWATARAGIDEQKRLLPAKPYAETVRVVVNDPRTGHVIEARGVIAVSPGKAARMIVVGPGGMTALDLWVTPARFRFVVPALHLERRGGTDAGDSLGLPVGMLRWWFVSPLAGRLLSAESDATSKRWTLKDHEAVVSLRVSAERSRYRATRRERGRLEEIDTNAIVPAAGTHGRYVDHANHVTIDVFVEAMSPNEPAPEAFADPDLEEP